MRVSDIQQIITGLLGQAGKNEKKELVPGSVITALLKEIKGNTALLNYLGTDFVARLETDAPAGERLRFYVEGKKEGQTVLKLLGNEKESNDFVLGGIVKNLGLSDDSVNLKIVGEMLKQKMPLDPGIAGKISTFVKTLNLAEPDMWIPVFMQNNLISLTPPNYRQVSALVNDVNYLQQDITNLSDEIAKLAFKVDFKGESAQLAAAVSKLLAHFKLNTEEGLPDNVHKFSTVFRLLMPEASGITGSRETAVSLGMLNSKVMPETRNFADIPVKSLTLAAGGSPAVLHSAATESHAVPGSVSGTPGVSLPLEFSQRFVPIHELQLGEAGEHVKNLDSLLNKLSGMLRENGEPEYKEVLKMIQDVSDKLEFIRNFNSYSELGRENMLVTYSSVKFGQNEAPFRLLVKYRQESREKVQNFASCRMVIRLNTPVLGLVKCEVQVMEKNLTLQFFGDSTLTASFIDRFTGILVSRLDELKFNVNLLPTRASMEKENDFLTGELHNIPGLFQLNLKI